MLRGNVSVLPWAQQAEHPYTHPVIHQTNDELQLHTGTMLGIRELDRNGISLLPALVVFKTYQ